MSNICLAPRRLGLHVLLVKTRSNFDGTDPERGVFSLLPSPKWPETMEHHETMDVKLFSLCHAMIQ